MTDILDQYGSPARQRFALSVNRDRHRGLVVVQNNDRSIHELIPSGDRRALAYLSRKVVFNSGPAKECIRQKASWSVLDAWRPTYGGPDQDAGEDAVAWLEEEWFPRMDFCGQIRDWRQWLETTSKAIDRDGEPFVLLTRREDGGHAVKFLPAYAVRCDRDEKVKGGKWDGAKLRDGIGYDEFDRVLFYRVFSDRDNFEDLPAASVVHDFERDFPEQLRGFPAFAANLDDILQGIESKKLEVLRQLLISNIFLVNKGGAPPRSTLPGYESATDTATNETIVKETVSPGIHYLKSGQELESVLQTTPGDVWESFQDRLWREAIIGAGWSYSLCWKSSRQGTAERAEVVRARLAVRSRIATLTRLARRVLAWAMADPAAPRVSDLSAWSFSRPARLTVDDGREDRALLEAVKAGVASEADYQAMQGRTREEHFRNRAMDVVRAREIAAEFGVDPADLLVRADAPGTEESPEITLPDD